MHVVICGFSRSGTTLFYNMLRSSVTNFRFFEQETGALWPRAVQQRDHDIITKRPLDVMQAEHILDETPDSRVIVNVRDPRSLLVSRHEDVPNDYFIDWDLQYFIPKQGEPRKRNPGIIPIYHQIKKIQHRVTILKYEGLVSSPDTVQDRLGTIFPFDYQSKFEDFHQNEIPPSLRNQLNGVRQVETTRISAWKQHPQRILQQFNEAPELFQVLEDFGYETDQGWFETLRAKTPAAR